MPVLRVMSGLRLCRRVARDIASDFARSIEIRVRSAKARLGIAYHLVVV